MTMANAPKPRRMNRPRWLDARVIGGVLVLVVAVVIGAKLIGAASHTSPVWAAARDLAAGTVLVPGDLVEAQVNLGEQASGYLDAASAPAGRVLTRPVSGGELLPAGALASMPDGRIIAVGVTPDRMPPGVAHGSVIDLYLTTGGSGLVGNDARTALLQAGVTVQSVTAPASGGLSGATSSRYQVALLLPPAEADALVRALPTGEPMVVLRTERSGGAAGGLNAGPGDGAAGDAPEKEGGSSTTPRGQNGATGSEPATSSEPASSGAPTVGSDSAPSADGTVTTGGPAGG